MTLYSIREKMAYSAIGKMIATLARDVFFPKCRVHWVQQAFADLSTRSL